MVVRQGRSDRLATGVCRDRPARPAVAGGGMTELAYL